MSLAEATAGQRVAITGLRVRGRRRKGRHLFYLTAECGRSLPDEDTRACSNTSGRGRSTEAAAAATLTLVCMSARDGELRPGLMAPHDHACAFDHSSPGACLARVDGSLSVPESSTATSTGVAALVLRVDSVRVATEGGSHAVPPSRAMHANGSASHGGGSGTCLVFDMAFDNDMTPAEHGGLARQLTMCVAANRRARQPFHLVVSAHTASSGSGKASSSDTLLDPPGRPGSSPWQSLPWKSWGVQEAEGATPWSVFDASRVVYLTADSPHTLAAVLPGDVFVLGGVVDHREKPNIALQRALSASNTICRAGADNGSGCSTICRAGADDDSGSSTRDAGGGAHQTLGTCLEGANDDAGDNSAGAGGKSARSHTQPPLRTARLPLEDHIKLSKNAHLPLLACAQILMLVRDTPGGCDWRNALARCPALRCAPLRKYVTWLPPNQHLNNKDAPRPHQVTDTLALS